MALSIKNPRAEALAEEVARVAGETKTDAVINALEERLARLLGRRAAVGDLSALKQIAAHCASLPDLDHRTPEEILGYDENGLP
ncbi:MAG: type II toxin-antitoxin system VapB family antitoxin [Bradymonadales bacterium]|nr:type II toxin-antitoxin system VapB family antitoxin [Bradymonadales bacterium]